MKFKAIVFNDFIIKSIEKQIDFDFNILDFGLSHYNVARSHVYWIYISYKDYSFYSLAFISDDVEVHNLSDLCFEFNKSIAKCVVSLESDCLFDLSMLLYRDFIASYCFKNNKQPSISNGSDCRMVIREYLTKIKTNKVISNAELYYISYEPLLDLLVEKDLL